MKAVIAGATGLIGNELLHLLESDASLSSLLLLTRREIVSKNKKVRILLCDFATLDEVKVVDTFDVGFCCLGTTIKKAGSQENFRHVDFDYVLNFARFCKELKIEHFIVVSALGADPNSKVFYNRVKGEMEQALSQLGFKKLSVVRPSLLLGKRNEKRFGEDVAKAVAPLVNFFLGGNLKKYKPIEARTVAETMISLARGEREKIPQQGLEVLEKGL